MPKELKKENILFFDIETSDCIIATYGKGKQYVGDEQILKDRKVLCISYKWKDEKKTYNLKLDMKKLDTTIHTFDDDSDKEMIVKFMKIYEKATTAVAHNGRRFDIERLRARLFKYQLPDIISVIFDDTYSMTKSIGLTSHRLDFIARVLNLKNKKQKTTRSMWIDVIKGDAKALNDMSSYCGQDVEVLAEAYPKITPYGKTQRNLAVYNKNPNICANCGSENLYSKGYKQSGLGIRKQVQCQDCGRHMTYGTNKLKNPKKYPR